MKNKCFLLFLGIILFYSLSTSQAADIVEKWNKWELSLYNSTHSDRPFELFPQITFTHEDGETLMQNGFYDDNDTWKFRFMCHKTGEWSYSTSSSDPDLDGHTGSFTVVASDHPGMLTKDPNNPKTWAYAEGQSHWPFYAGLHNPKTLANRQEVDNFVVWMEEELGASGVGIALTNVIWKSAEDLNYPYASADQSQGFSVKRFEDLEYLLGKLNEMRFGMHILFYYDDSAQPPFAGKSAQEELLFKYVNARLSAYSLVIFDSGGDIGEYRSGDWPEWFVDKMKEFDPWDHCVGNRYGWGSGSYDPPNSGYTSSGRRWIKIDNSAYDEMVIEYDALNDKPIFYADQWREENGYTSTELKRAGWIASMVGNVGWKIGNSGDFDIANPTLTDLPAYKAYGELWQSLGYIGDFQRCNDLITDGYCIGRHGEICVFFKMNTNSMSVDLSALTSSKPAYWINVTNGEDTTIENLSPGHHNLNAPSTNDWVLVVGKTPTGFDSTPGTIPENLSADTVSESQINLTWQPSTDPESGINKYIIYRDGTKVGESTTTSFSDTGLTENSTHTYEVSAVNGAGLESEKSASVSATTMADTTAPTVISVTTSGDPNKVTVVFSEPVEEASSENMSNYGVDNGVTISGASLASDLKTVVLTTSPHTDGVTYTLSVNNIKDRASTPNVIAANTQVTYAFAGQLVISNLTVNSGKAYEVVENGLQSGSLAYIDRSYTFKDVPASLLGATYIKTANDDKGLTGSSFITFEVNQDVTVYVAHDNRITTKPSWMASFTDTGDDLVTTDSTLSIFAKDFSAGTVTLGGNEGGGNSMYSVIIVAQDNPPLAAPTGLRKE